MIILASLIMFCVILMADIKLSQGKGFKIVKLFDLLGQLNICLQQDAFWKVIRVNKRSVDNYVSLDFSVFP